jgi:hypothetical protein
VPLQAAETSAAFASLNCPRCVPPWSASPVHLDRLPWSAAPINTGRERYRCPGCGGQVRATFHSESQRHGERQ